MLSDSAPFSEEIVLYKSVLSDLSTSTLGSEKLRALALGPGPKTDESIAISDFSLLLSKLKVPGPCDFLPRPTLPLGHGSQFTVAKQEVIGLTDLHTFDAAFNNSVETAAIKIPKLILDRQTKLDLSSPEVRRHVCNMIIEIKALCHPSLRGHRNVVDLLGWGTSAETWRAVPFLALEVANNTLTDFLQESRFIPLELRHHISLDIGCGLDAVHDAELIHGDLKPLNVLMFCKSGCWVAKLTDFGGGADISQHSSFEGRGTSGWRAPELWEYSEQQKQLSPSLSYKIDSYSYGLMLWSLFFRNDGLAPCEEKLNAKMVALSDLESSPMPLPTSLHLALNFSFCALLENSPDIRAGKVGQLLNDGSRVYAEWAKLQTSRNGTHSPVSLPKDEVQKSGFQYEWETPEISLHYANAVRSAFLRKEPLSPKIIEALFMKYTGPESRFRQDNGYIRDVLLDLLHAGARKGSQPLRALIHVVHEHFQLLAEPDVDESKSLWMSEAVAGGAFFLRNDLQRLDSGLLETSVQQFHNCGGYSHFYAALNRGATSEIFERVSLESAGSLNTKESLNSRGDKLLHILSSFTNSDVLEKIIGVTGPQEINTVNDCGETALYRACMAGQTSNILLLLSKGADPSIAPSPYGPTCLHWLFHFNTREVDTIAKALIKHGAQINSVSKQKIPMLHYPFTLPIGTPLHWAVDMSAVEATRSLLRHGANQYFRDGSDPYAYDENVRHLDMSLPPDWVRYSVAKNTTLGCSAIDVAVKNRDHEILGVLLSSHSSTDANDSDEEGYSAIHRLDAGEWRHTVHGTAIWCPLFQGPTATRIASLRKTVTVLLQHGFELDKLTNPRQSTASGLGYSGQTALMIAVTGGHTETITCLLDAGANVNLGNTEGETALLSFTDHYLFDRAQQSEVVSLLLGANANVYARDSRGKTPFLGAASMGLLEVATALINHDANLIDRISDTTSRRRGMTAFALLARCPLPQVPEHDIWFMSQLKVHILPRLEQPEGLTIRNELLEKADLDGGTLLHYTAMEGLVRSCATLIEAKVNINGLRRYKKLRRGGTVISYRTPLDESLKSRKYRRISSQDQFPEQEYEKRMTVYSDIVKLLRDAGGLQSKALIKKEFIAPRDKD